MEEELNTLDCKTECEDCSNKPLCEGSKRFHKILTELDKEG